MPHVCIHGSTQCAVEKAPTRSQLLTCYFFIFFFKKYKLIYEFGSERYAEMGENGKFNKKLKWTILTKEFGATYLCNRLSHRWLGTEGKGSCGWLPGAVIKEPRFVPPVLELVK